MTALITGCADDDPWVRLRAHTAARIALGRCGGSLPTAALLAFARDHALARDAVHAPFARETVGAQLAAIWGTPALPLASRAADRATYLRRPDLGRSLDAESLARCHAAAGMGADVAIVVGDGLSAVAAEIQAPAVCAHLVPTLRDHGLTLAAPAVVAMARVAIGDEIGQALNARLVVVLIGERPGLGTPDSLGAYITHGPHPGLRDGERNCVSNIRPAGLPPVEGAAAIAWLVREALRRGLTGVRLKDERRLVVEAKELI